MNHVFVRLLLPLTLTLTSSAAQAAEFRLGAQLGAITAFGAGGAAGEAGVQLSLQTPLNAARTLQLRGTLEGGAAFGAGLASPLLRLDTALLFTGGNLYYGGGLGSGVALVPGSTADLPTALFSPLLLLNAHGIVGKDFGPFALEGLVRVGLLPSIHLRASIPLN
jgi:hypothetical protein